MKLEKIRKISDTINTITGVSIFVMCAFFESLPTLFVFFIGISSAWSIGWRMRDVHEEKIKELSE